SQTVQGMRSHWGLPKNDESKVFIDDLKECSHGAQALALPQFSTPRVKQLIAEFKIAFPPSRDLVYMEPSTQPLFQLQLQTLRGKISAYSELPVPSDDNWRRMLESMVEAKIEVSLEDHARALGVAWQVLPTF